MFIDQKQYEKLSKEVPRFQVVTVSVLCDKFKINGAVARKVLKDFAQKGLIKQCGDHNAHFTLYTGSQYGKVDKVPDVKGGEKKGQEKGEGGKPEKKQQEKKGAKGKEVEPVAATTEVKDK